MKQGYAIDPLLPKERQRLMAIEAIYDEYSIGRLEALQVQPGWNVLEVAAGGGSITRWLSERVGPTGRVVATDLDLRFIGELDRANVEVRHHDIVSDPLEVETFDLVHTRMLLTHLPARDAVLRRLISATRPGGWLLAEEFDVDGSKPGPDQGIDLQTRVERACWHFIALAGGDTRCGRKLPRAFRDGGLVDVGSDVHSRVLEGGSPGSAFFTLSMENLGERMIEAGLVTSSEKQAFIDQWHDVTFSAIGPVVVSAWGRRA